MRIQNSKHKKSVYGGRKNQKSSTNFSKALCLYRKHEKNKGNTAQFGGTAECAFCAACLLQKSRFTSSRSLISAIAPAIKFTFHHAILFVRCCLIYSTFPAPPRKKQNPLSGSSAQCRHASSPLRHRYFRSRCGTCLSEDCVA